MATDMGILRDPSSDALPSHGADDGDEILRGADVKEAVLEDARLHLDESPRVDIAGSDGVESLGGLGDAAAHHGGDANANKAAPEARLAAEFAARRWSASLLRGARFVLSPVADGVFHLTLYVLESPISRFVGHLVAEARELGHGMLAFAALIAMAARRRPWRPRRGHGGTPRGRRRRPPRSRRSLEAALVLASASALIGIVALFA